MVSMHQHEVHKAHSPLAELKEVFLSVTAAMTEIVTKYLHLLVLDFHTDNNVIIAHY